MHITIKYPDDFKLHGWDRAIFAIRIANMFRHDWVDVCALDACRSKINPDTERTALRDELGELHCASFRKLPDTIVDALPAKVSEYLGVDVRRSYRAQAITIAVRAGVASFVAVIALVAWLALKPEPMAPAHTEIMGTGEALHPMMPAELSALRSVQQPVADEETPDPVFSASMTTATPMRDIPRLVSAMRDDGRQYDVSITVTPSAAPSDANSPR
jgi:hypothetical protein